MQDHEELFLLVRLDDISDDVVSVLDVNPQHLDGLAPVLNWFDGLLVDSLLQVADPEVFSQGAVAYDSRLDESGGDEEVLVDVVEQVLEVDVHARFGVDCGLFVRQEVVELHDTHRHGLVFLCLDHELAQLYVLDQFGEHGGVEVAALREIPPIFAGEGCVGIVA